MIQFSEEEEQNFRDSVVGGKLPDGQYIGRLTNVEVVERKYKNGDSGRALELSYTVDSPDEHMGGIHTHSLSFKTKQMAGYAKYIISLFRVDVSCGLAECEEQLMKMIGAKVYFTLFESDREDSKGNKYQNCKIASVDFITAKINNDDIPF